VTPGCWEKSWESSVEESPLVKKTAARDSTIRSPDGALSLYA
jgi:hypothetical protein